MSREQSAGFSLIEMLLSVSIIGLLAGLSLPLYAGFVARNDLDLTAQDVASALRRAQSSSRSANGDTSWGIAIQSGNIIVFKGASYATRDNTYDEITDIPDSITPTGLTEIVFTKLGGVPSTTGNIILTSNTSNTKTVTLNAKGMVSY